MVFRAHKIIIAYFVLTTISLVVPYSLAVLLGHASPVIPYMADIGDQPLESTIFTQCFVVDAAVFMLIVQIRFVYVSFFLEKRRAPRQHKVLNDAAMVTGYLVALGLLILACFQESHAFYFQKVGACLFFLGSAVYFTLQCLLSKAVASSSTDEIVVVARIVLNSIMYVLLATFAVGYVVALKSFSRPWEKRCLWGPDDGGWVPHVVSASAQWALLFVFIAYLFTFCHEFRKVHLTGTRMTVLSEEDPMPTWT